MGRSASTRAATYRERLLAGNCTIVKDPVHQDTAHSRSVVRRVCSRSPRPCTELAAASPGNGENNDATNSIKAGSVTSLPPFATMPKPVRKPNRASTTSETIAAGCSIPGSGPWASRWRPASSKAVARMSSEAVSSTAGCTGPSAAPTPSSRFAPQSRATGSTTSGSAAQSENEWNLTRMSCTHPLNCQSLPPPRPASSRFMRSYVSYTRCRTFSPRFRPSACAERIPLTGHGRGTNGLRGRGSVYRARGNGGGYRASVLPINTSASPCGVTHKCSRRRVFVAFNTPCRAPGRQQFPPVCCRAPAQPGQACWRRRKRGSV